MEPKLDQKLDTDIEGTKSQSEDSRQYTTESLATKGNKYAIKEMSDMKRVYEQGYRDNLAGYLSSQRMRNRSTKQEQEKLYSTEDINKNFDSHISIDKEQAQKYIDQLQMDIRRGLDNLIVLEGELDNLKGKNSNFFERLRRKYNKFYQDRINKTISEINLKKTEIETFKSKINEENKKLENKISELEKGRAAKLESANKMKNETEKEYLEDKKDLLARVRYENRISKNAVKNTFEGFESGELDVSRLAKESNSLVVHAIPLDGMNMKSTDHKNKSADTLSMSAMDKAREVISGNHDLASSVINMGRRYRQNMFYPFGFILDGKLVSIQESDAGTVTAGDYRRLGDNKRTLLVKPKDRFMEVANKDAKEYVFTQHNEAVIHSPKVKGILIDRTKLDPEFAFNNNYRPREVKVNLSPEEARLYLDKHKKAKIVSQGVLEDGEYAGQQRVNVVREMGGLEIATEFAKDNFPDLKIYFLDKDGVYDESGKKVSAEDLY